MSDLRTVAIYSDNDLLERAVRNAHFGRSRGPRWSRVADAFAMGSTFSAQLCRRFNLDPNEQVGIEPEEVDEDE